MQTEAIDGPKALDSALDLRLKSARRALLTEVESPKVKLIDVLTGISAAIAFGLAVFDQSHPALWAMLFAASLVQLSADRQHRQIAALRALIER